MNADEAVENACAWLAEKGVVAVIVYRDSDGLWEMAGTNYPALPGILRKMADEAESRLTRTN